MSPTASPTPLVERPLLIFDFDDSFVTNDESFSAWMQRVAEPGEDVPRPSGRDVDDAVHWQKTVYGWLKERGFGAREVLEFVAASKEVTDGVEELVTRAREELNTVVIILSDNNTSVIEHTLRALKADHLVDHIIANPSTVVDDLIVSQPYRQQSHCQLSFRNLCKGDALWEYVARLERELGVRVTRVGYVGDGRNDLCPALRLRSQDIMFARAGYKLEPILREREAEMKAKTFYWEDGIDMLREWRALNA